MRQTGYIKVMEELDPNLIFDDVSEGTDVLALLKSGTPVVTQMEDQKRFLIHIDQNEDVPEVQDAKENIEFVVNSAREAISFLMTLGQQTGNPRYFETINALLNTINGANNQLLGINKRSQNNNQQNGNAPMTQVNVQMNVPMTTTEAMAASSVNRKLIDG